MAGAYKDAISQVSSDDLLGVLKATDEKGIHGQFHEEFVKCLNAIKSKPIPSIFF